LGRLLLSGLHHLLCCWHVVDVVDMDEGQLFFGACAMCWHGRKIWFVLSSDLLLRFCVLGNYAFAASGACYLPSGLFVWVGLYFALSACFALYGCVWDGVI